MTNFDRELLRGDTLFFLTAIYQDLTTQQLFTVPVTNPATQPPPNCAPYNIPNGTRIWFTAKNYKNDPDTRAVFELDNTMAFGGIAIVQAASGKISVTGPALATVNFPDSPVSLTFDIQMKDTSNRIFTIESGVLTVSPDVTRATS